MVALLIFKQGLLETSSAHAFDLPQSLTVTNFSAQPATGQYSLHKKVFPARSLFTYRGFREDAVVWMRDLSSDVVCPA